MTKTEKSYQLICGMEIHVELKTASKMFCGCKNDPFFAPKPNMYTCPVCLGMPGGLPLPNQKAIEWVIKLGLALGCEINLFSKFDRKNYFYPDLPKGYQISQYDIPFCINGQIETTDGPVRIRRIHLEEDTGKLLHTTVNGKKVSLIDFNRGGVPLVEIVTEPDIYSPAQAKEYGKKLRQILRFLEIADCDMEQGGMRLEANVSITKTPETLPNYKVELKNINSFRFLEQAIGFEIQRQALLLDDGQTPAQETRGWNTSNNTTYPQRTKEDAEDYRYFPDPDIPPIRFTQKQIETWRSELPELPDAIIKRWTTDLKIESKYAERLVETTAQVKWVETLHELAQKSKLDTNKVLAAFINKKLSISSPEPTADEVITAFQSANQTETVDTSELETIIQSVLVDQADAVNRYKNGQTQLLNFFVGQTMRQLGKKVDIALVKTALEKALST
jgi:aspartyl-tRNA(Asn)/glutamyl-tRNA(Gln) amidotransferase subunit B